MSVQIKVLPATEAAVGLVHPLDGPLAADGSLWTHDAFTERCLQAQVIRRFEVDADAAGAAAAEDGATDAGASAEAKPAKAKPQAAA